MEQILVKRANNSEYLLEDKNKGSFITSIIQSTELRSNDVINVELTSREFINFTIGDYFHYLGQKYTLNQIPRYFKNSSNDFQFSMTFEGAMFDLRRASYDVNIDTTGSAIYGETLTADLELFATILIENINRVFPGKWVLGEIPAETETKTITFSEEENCLAALQMLCDEYDTDFIIKTDNNGVNILNFKQVGNEIPLEFKVGFQKGLYNLTREKVDASDIVTRLKVYGSDKNLGTDYRANRLVLKDKNKPNSYIENTQAIAKYGIYESTKIFDDIYPRRKGKVTSINSSSPYKFSDSSMDFDLKEKDENGTKYLLNGVNAKIHFNTGDLAGYELEIHDYNHETNEFHIIKFADENSYEFPSKDNDAFRIGIGDEYVILDIQMPQVYIDNAEAELFEKSNEYLSDKLEPNIQYLLDVDTLHLQRILNDTVTQFFSIGDFIKVVDEDFDINRYIRIKSIERDLKNPFDYKLTLSDSKVTNFLSGTIPGEINNINKIIKINNLNNPAKARRNWKDAQEVLNMVFDVEGDYYTEKIKPNSIETTHLQVGAKSMQFNLIDSFFEPNFESNPNKIRWSTCKLVHFAISDNIVEWQIQGGQKDLEANKPYYLYAKCNKSNNIGVIEITETQYTVDQGSFYYFLIGIINTYSEDIKAREISLMYGFTTVSGRFIKTGRISSNDGSTYFDLDSGEFKGKFTFTNGESVEEAIANQEIYIEYSQNGIDWHSTFLYDDVFMRQKKGDGAWSNAIRIVGIQGIKGDKGSDGQTQYVHIRYSANSDGSSMTTTPQANTTYIGIVTTTSSVAPTSNTSYTWAKFKGEQGTQGVPGIPGADGSSLFTWVKYADTPTSGMSDYPDDKLYIGLAYNKVTATESDNYEDYSWSLMPQNIEIGGRNLYKGTKDFSGNDWSTYGWYKELETYKGLTIFSRQYDWVGVIQSLTLELGLYTYSCYVKRTSIDKKILLLGTGNEVGDAKGNIVNSNLSEFNSNPLNTWFRLQFTVEITQPGKSMIRIEGYNGNSSKLYICGLKLEKGNKATDWTPAPEDVEASIEQAKQNSINASKAYSDAQDELKRIQTEAYADGKITDAEQRAIQDATNKAEAAKTYADAQDNLLRTQLEAYADGQITAEEQARIQQMQDNLATAKAYADAQANLAKIASNAYADGVVDEEEARAIADATAKMEAAKAHAQGLVNNIQIGGRNLYKGTEKFSGNDWVNLIFWTRETETYNGFSVISRNGDWTGVYQPINVKVGDVYTFSAYIKKDAPTVDCYLFVSGDEGQGQAETSSLVLNTEVNKWEKITSVIKITQEGVIKIRLEKSGVGSMYCCGLKLEKGNKATDWTPAPEDVEASILQAKQLAEQANQKVTDISNDNILSASEKQQISNEWNRIKSEYTSNYSLAINNGIATTNFTNSYNDLFNYITPLLVNISVDSPIVGSVFRTKFKAYYDQNIALIVAINDKLRSGINTNTGAINRINQITSFLDTTINGNVIGTGVLMVGSATQSNAGISGLNESGSESVRFWAGGTAQNRDKANWVMHDDGVERTFHPNGNLATVRGIINGVFTHNYYHQDGYLLFKLDANRGLVNVAYTQESWSQRKFARILNSNINASDYEIQILVEPLITMQGEFYTIEQNKLTYICYEYHNGTLPANADLQQYNGYKTNNTEKIGNNIPNGWYIMNYGPLMIDMVTSKPVVRLTFVENGIEKQNKTLVMTNF